MRLEIDIAEHHYNNIMALDSVSIGRVPYKGIIMYSINAIKHGKVLDQESTTKNDTKFCPDRKAKTTNMETILHCIENDCVAYKDGKCLKYNSDQEPTTKNDCEHCSKTYGTLGCCDFVSNEPVYSCKEGHEEYARGIRKLGTTTKNDLGVDCISRDDVRHVMQELWGTSGELMDRLMALPSVTPQKPKKGHKVSGDLLGGLYCSECMTYVNEYFNYCPHCGAKMESEAKR